MLKVSALGGSSHWLTTRMADPPKELLAVRPAERLQPVEPPPIPVAMLFEEPEPDAPAPERRLAATASDDEITEPWIDPEPVEPSPVEPIWVAAKSSAGEWRGPRKFGAMALFMSGIGGAAGVAAAVLVFESHRQRWEPAVSHAVHVDAVKKAPVEQAAGDAAKFAEIVTAFETGRLEIPGIYASPARTGEPDEAREPDDAHGAPEDAHGEDAASVRRPQPRREDGPRFSALIPASPLTPAELSMPGTSLSYALPIIASDFEPEFELTDDTVERNVSFSSMQLAEAVEAEGATTAGVVVSDGQHGVLPAPAQGSGTLVVEGLTGGVADAANDGDTVVLSLPAGTRKVDARLHLIAPDGRLALTSQLSVVVADKPETMSQMAPFKASQRKAAAPAVRSTKASAARLANGGMAQKLPPPQPARQPRGLFNFDGPPATP